MFYALRELSIVFMCFKTSAALFNSSFCLYFLGSMPSLIIASSMSWWTAGLIFLSIQTAFYIVLFLKSSSQQFYHIQYLPSFSIYISKVDFSFSVILLIFVQNFAYCVPPSDCLVPIGLKFKFDEVFPNTSDSLLLSWVAPSSLLFYIYSSLIFFSLSL